MSDLVDFLRSRFAEQGRAVESLAADAEPGDDEMWAEYSDAEIRIVDLHSGPHVCPGHREHAHPADQPYVGCDTLRLLAFDLRDDPAFRTEWLPTDPPDVIRTYA